MSFTCSMLVVPHSSITAANLNILDVDKAVVAFYFLFVILKWLFTKVLVQNSQDLVPT